MYGNTHKRSMEIGKHKNKKKKKRKSRIGFKLSPKAYQLPYLLFAYDSLLFCRTNLESCQKLSTLLNRFCQSLGEIINFHKSTITFSKNATVRDRQTISYVFKITQQDNLNKCLGCPVFKGRPKVDAFLELINRTTKLQT